VPGYLESSDEDHDLFELQNTNDKTRGEKSQDATVMLVASWQNREPKSTAQHSTTHTHTVENQTRNALVRSFVLTPPLS
jgi:hypothetical protein